MMATVRDEILSVLRDAWEIVRADPHHVLPYGFRFRVWEAMGPRRKAGQPPSEPHTRRTHLAMACARRAMPAWDSRWPDKPTMRHALTAAEDALAHPLHWRPYIKVVEACEMEVESVISSDFNASYAGVSAIDALRVAIYDESSTDDEFGEGDVQVGGPLSDAAGNAVIALANGTPANPKSDPQRRYDFWRWYLGEAVPAVYDAPPIDLGS